MRSAQLAAFFGCWCWCCWCYCCWVMECFSSLFSMTCDMLIIKFCEIILATMAFWVFFVCVWVCVCLCIAHCMWECMKGARTISNGAKVVWSLWFRVRIRNGFYLRISCTSSYHMCGCCCCWLLLVQKKVNRKNRPFRSSIRYSMCVVCEHASVIFILAQSFSLSSQSDLCYMYTDTE